ncbi:hypothetical protein [Streptomyces prunicolor]|uniref:Uncharacterized protein n=1 Tax=Streptomyces prunicolor TaxID=67348 RepID=A0ABU4FAZ9_9ACTN|nr:hypothetical protein [Streptomyces prunicolor]MDV7217773.1 hypothetical protein [Streptomyces prunicolor]
MSLVELIAQADERALAASGLACLDRCVPLLGGDDEVLRPLWTSLADGAEGETWGECLEQARAKLPALFEEPGEEAGEGPGEGPGEDRAVRLARQMLATAPAVPAGTPVREWADACSVASLRIHRLLEVMVPAAGADDDVDSRREGRTEGMSPLVAAELRRQIAVLELLAGTGNGTGPAFGGLRQVLAVSTEGRRVLRAVVSRRARGRS